MATQWAAVRAQLTLIRVAPHLPSNSLPGSVMFSSISTNHGNSPGLAYSPPTIKISEEVWLFRIPHSLPLNLVVEKTNQGYIKGELAKKHGYCYEIYYNKEWNKGSGKC